MSGSTGIPTGNATAGANWLVGGGVMGERIRAHDWAATPIGTPDQWPQSLRSAVSILLPSRAQIVLFWGPELAAIYNDAYTPVFGSKHPWALGRPAKECWSEVWHILGPLFENVVKTGEAFWAKDYLFLLNREGFLEETYFDVSYDPIRIEDGSVGGIFCIVSDQTGRVLGERRLKTLRELGARTADSKTTSEACRAAAQALATNAEDVPFSLIYLFDTKGAGVELVGSSGAASDMIISAETAAAALLADARDGHATEIDAGRFLSQLPDTAVERALTLPLRSSGRVVGAVVVGVSRHLRLEGPYRDFFNLTAAGISAAIDRARSYEEERRRAEALAEIDRAKTTFFSNVSHEFRTPLTLMMGPLDDVLTDAGELSPADRERLTLAQRNALRLLKLVNTLLDFSRIEAGRIEASYEPADLPALTAELASVFRSAIERAGMELIVDCRPLSQSAYVDREMWEKIVLNLLSNAFKFTFEGRIEVSLREVDAAVEMSVRDTGTGIPAAEIPRLFERFHRIKGARGRSFEGSGIGLALVQELVKLHGGSVSVESEVGKGSRFTVSIPLGSSHLPPDRIQAARTLGSTALGADAFLTEVFRWTPDGRHPVSDDATDPSVAPVHDEGVGEIRERAGGGERVLVADDNADMREYLRRILAGYEVEAVPNGGAALRAARKRKPDLVLTDIMMPEMDGFQLLYRIRADATLSDIPVILVSARAGEEAKIEGMNAGADDYIIKPFSARELLARVESHLKLARTRREATASLRHRTAQFETLFNRAPLGLILLDSDCRVLEVNPVALPEFGDTPGGIIGRNFSELVSAIWKPDYAEVINRIFRRTLETGEPYSTPEWSGIRNDHDFAEHYEWKLERIVLPDGAFGLVCYFRDISQRVQADATRQLLLNELNHRVKNTLAIVQAIAQQTLRRTRDPADFATRFTGRIQSLARVHSLLTDAHWQSADLQKLIQDQLLEVAVDERRLIASGPAVRLEPQMTVHLALMLHELGTNSAKYGALAAAGGTVTIAWTVEDKNLSLRWVERGGPPVRAPIVRGFGTSLIEQSANSDGGHAEMLCEATGVTWKINLPLREQAQPASLAKPDSFAPRPHPQQPAVTRAALRGLRLLVVEDEPLIALDLADMLEKAGAEVVGPVGTVSGALESIDSGGLDAVLLDANLHGASVDAVASALTRRQIPFVFVTGYGRSGLETAFKHAPVLTKPVSPADLIEVFARLTERDSSVVRLNREEGDAVARGQ